MLLLAIAAAVVVTGIRWTRRGGDWDLVFRVAVWGVAAGIVGARALPRPHELGAGARPEAARRLRGVGGRPRRVGRHRPGALVGAIVVHRSGASVSRFLDAVAPGLLLAHAIGRWGNWWNQELFGSPTEQPWGLEIDLERRPTEYLSDPTFHPTFLYESLYCLIGVGLLLVVERLFRSGRPGCSRSTWSYYCFGRFFEELLRVDPSHELLGLRINAWVAAVGFVAAGAFFVWWQFLPCRGTEPPPERKLAQAAVHGDPAHPR